MPPAPDPSALSPAARRLVVHWGEMGARWGISRTVAQVHALLFVSPRPLDAARIAAALGVARSNVSTSLRELQAWGLVRVTHVLGDRRDHFQTIADPWQLFRTILDARWQREVAPTLLALDECLADAGRSGREVELLGRLEELRAFFRALESWYRQLQTLDVEEIKRVARLGSRVRRLLRL